MPSHTIEEYLEAIYRLTEHGPVRASRVAETLGVSGPTVTATLQRLDRDGFIDRPSGRVSLTEAGRRAALDIIRRHRLAERFLADVLGLPWEDVHEEACLLEHALSPRVQAALEAYLDNPATCPHGHPIPSADGSVVEAAGEPLSTLGKGESAAILRVDEDIAGLLGYLASIGLYPGTTVVVRDVAPLDGALLVESSTGQLALSRETAERIIVERRPKI